MGKPIVNKINTYDAAYDCTVTFSYVGNQPYKNRLVVIDTLTNNIVLDETIDNMKLTHTITASTLTNGMSYTAQISVFDGNNNESDLSEKMYFTCYATPVFDIEGLNKNNPNTIKSANYNAVMLYLQEQSRSLKSYQFYLYDAAKKEIRKSDIIYHTSNNEISYQYKSFDNNTVYYIRCIGETVDNVSVDSGYYELLTDYVVSNSYNLFNVTNNDAGGYIQCNTNITLINGETNDDITIESGIADMIGKSVVYKEGFVLDGDFVIGLKIQNPMPNEIICRCTNNINSITLYHYLYENLHYFKLSVDNGLNNYILYSDRFNLIEDEIFSVYITRKNNLYQIDIIKE